MPIIKTAEFVSPKHPDKICDRIADTILDLYLAQDPDSRVAVEVMGGHNLIVINGEITSKGEISQENIRDVLERIVGDGYKILWHVDKQSPFIAQGVDAGGAGDQGIMVGYATNETPELMPLEYQLARDLCQKIFFKYSEDGKTQVTTVDGKVKTVVVSFCNTKNEQLLEDVKELIEAEEYLINPAGEWTQGGFDADTGLSGRKLVIDNYGPEISLGGGSFSGKDQSKVDRSGAYMARRIAVDLLKSLQANTVMVKLAYAIGKAEPVMAVALINGTEQIPVTGYDLTPRGIRKFLQLDQPNYYRTAAWGHFGREFNWK